MRAVPAELGSRAGHPAGPPLAALATQEVVMIRVAVAVEDAIPRWALCQALAKEADLHVVGDAGTVEDVLAMVKRTLPDVVVVDPAVPDHARFDVLEELRQLEHGGLVVALSQHDEPSYAARAIAKGAHGYVATSSPPDTLLTAIRAVSRGEQVIPPAAAALHAAGDTDPVAWLTGREVQVMEMLARGMTNSEVAVQLGISTKTIDTHRGHVLKKLGLRNNAELVRFALKHGYVAA
jgi:two-component system, NarL family, invasion response regulator UvrY